MKIVLFSDIHANLPALQAMFKDLERHQPDMIYCLGDLVGYNIWPNEVIDEIRSRKIPVIAGNYDEGVGKHSDDCGCAYKTDEEKAMGKISIAVTNQLVTDSSRAYLRTLPSHLNIQFKLNEEVFNLLLVHGSPRRVNEYLFEDRDEKSFWRIAEQADADMMCFGHTHKPYHRILRSPDVPGKLRHAINTGSVGKPKDGDPRGCYVLLTFNENSLTNLPDSFRVEFIRFKYDVEKAARAVEESDLPDAFAAMLRKGG